MFETCKSTKQKFRERFNALEAQNKLILKKLDDLAAQIKRIEAGFDDDDEVNGSQDLPSSVYNTETLRQFIVAWFGESWLVALRYPDKKSACMELRDALAKKYDNLQRLNDQPQHPQYPDVPEEKHADALYMATEKRVVDFCSGSSDSGSMAESISWLVHEITPW